MRFKARTDLERIYDAIHKNNVNTIDRSILNSNLSNLDPDIKRKQTLDEKNKIIYNFEKYGLDRSLIENMKKEENESKVKTLKYKPDNSKAKMLMKELYYKTHFKAASSFSLFGNKTKHKVTNESILKEENDENVRTLSNNDGSAINPGNNENSINMSFKVIISS